MADPIWIEGRAHGSGVLVSKTTLSWDRGKVVGSSRTSFDVVTDDGERLHVAVETGVVLAPAQHVKGPWREVRAHPTKPDPGKTLHDDGEVELEGAWVLDGDRVAVCGEPMGEQFVPDTGGPREAPRTKPTGVRAIAIGVGEHARADAEAERARRDQTGVREELAGRAFAWVQVPKHAAALSAAPILPALLLGAYGTAIYLFHLAVVWTWAAVPLVQMPGGAADDDEINRASMVAALNTFVTPIMFVMMPLMCGLMMDLSFEASDAMIGGILVFIVGFELVAMLRGLVTKPHAEPGYQIELPRRAGHRIALAVALVATLAGSVAWMAVAFGREHDRQHQH